MKPFELLSLVCVLLALSVEDELHDQSYDEHDRSSSSSMLMCNPLPLLRNGSRYLRVSSPYFFRVNATAATTSRLPFSDLSSSSCPYSDFHVSLDENDESNLRDRIPNCTTHLYFAPPRHYHYHYVHLHSLPSSITDLTFSICFNQALEPFALPASLSSLTLGMAFNQPIEFNHLPASLFTLIFSNAFNQPLRPGALPSKLMNVEFGDGFNQKLPRSTLPDTIQNLKFGRQFNQPFEQNSLPSQLLDLELHSYSHDIPANVLPPKLHRFQIRSSPTNASIVFPSSLTSLDVGYFVNGAFPHTVTRLTIYASTFYELASDTFSYPDVWPPRLKDLTLKWDIERPPSSLQDFPPLMTTIHFTASIHAPLRVPSIFPSTVTSIHLSDSFNHTFSRWSLPPTLDVLVLGQRFNQPLDPSMFYLNLTNLVFSWDSHFNQPIGMGILPESLTRLTFGAHFNHPLKSGVLPLRLTSLRFGHAFNQALSLNLLPPTLNYLEFGYSFNHPIAKGVLPTTMTQLSFGEQFNHPLLIEVLPSSLTHLTLGNQFRSPLFFFSSSFVRPHRHTADIANVGGTNNNNNDNINDKKVDSRRFSSLVQVTLPVELLLSEPCIADVVAELATIQKQIHFNIHILVAFFISGWLTKKRLSSNTSSSHLPAASSSPSCCSSSSSSSSSSSFSSPSSFSSESSSPSSLTPSSASSSSSSSSSLTATNMKESAASRRRRAVPHSSHPLAASSSSCSPTSSFTTIASITAATTTITSSTLSSSESSSSSSSSSSEVIATVTAPVQLFARVKFARVELREFAQHYHQLPPKFQFISQGPPHSPTFTCSIYLPLPNNGNNSSNNDNNCVLIAEATGASKATAEENAAKKALDHIEQIQKGGRDIYSALA